MQMYAFAGDFCCMQFVSYFKKAQLQKYERIMVEQKNCCTPEQFWFWKSVKAELKP